MIKEIKNDFVETPKMVVEGIGVVEFIDVRRLDQFADIGKMVFLARFLPDSDFDYTDFEDGQTNTLLGC